MIQCVETYGEYSYTYDELAQDYRARKKNSMSENLPKKNIPYDL